MSRLNKIKAYIEDLCYRFELWKDIILDYKKTSCMLVLSLILTGIYSYWWYENRLDLFYGCVLDEMDLERDTYFKHISGSCLVNEGTEDRPRYIITSRLLGVGQEGLETDVE